MTDVEKDTEKFFVILGEMWRDICLIEFLMRCALAQKKGDAKKFPQPPYKKGNVYKEFPDSFALNLFSDVAGEFNKEFPGCAIPQIIVDLRNAMAHGLIAEINRSGTEELVKFRKRKDGLHVEFRTTLEVEKISTIRNSLSSIRRLIAKESADK